MTLYVEPRDRTHEFPLPGADTLPTELLGPVSGIKNYPKMPLHIVYVLSFITQDLAHFCRHTRLGGSLSSSKALFSSSGRICRDRRGTRFRRDPKLDTAFLTLKSNRLYHLELFLASALTNCELSTASGSKKDELFTESSGGSLRGSAGPGSGVSLS